MDADPMFDPAWSLAQGNPLLLVRPTYRPPALQHATVQQHDAPMLVLELPLGEDMETGEEVLLVVRTAGLRFAGAGRFVAREGHTVTVHLDGEWRPVDSRSHYRFPAAHPATMRLDGHDVDWQATITDVSPNGLGVQAGARPESDVLELDVVLHDEVATLTCNVLSVQEADGRCHLSLCYSELDTTARDFADRLFEYYLETFGDSFDAAA